MTVLKLKFFIFVQNDCTETKIFYLIKNWDLILESSPILFKLDSQKSIYRFKYTIN